MSQDARRDEEQATARRANILGLAYVDTSQIANKALFKTVLPVAELNQFRVIPLHADAHNITFGITTRLICASVLLTSKLTIALFPMPAFVNICGYTIRQSKWFIRILR